jgi:hypothetical protein
MKKIKRILCFSLFVAYTASSIAQTTNTTKTSIAVAQPSVEGLYATPKIASKLINLELLKLNQFMVYDEFDMAEVVNQNEKFSAGCFGLNCLIELGETLKVDQVMSGSFDKLGAKIVITLKLIDVKSKSIVKTAFREFTNNEAEMQRMVEITLRGMFGLEAQKEIEDRLVYKNDVITSNNVGKLNNSGPRIGLVGLAGNLNEFASRSTSQGGMDMVPFMSMMGYQFEVQYVGTERFSALFETMFNVFGLEQGKFLPSVAFMNGFRFGKNGWEFAFGPSFGFKRTTTGFFDTNNSFGNGTNAYWRENDYNNYDYSTYQAANPYSQPEVYNYEDPFYVYQRAYTLTPSGYEHKENLDTRGNLEISTRFVFAVGRTFRTGALNVPVNVFYSSVKGGGMIGASVGFNILKKKEKINN